MTDPQSPEDEDLRARFAELRRDDARRAPDFARMWARTPPRRGWATVALTSGTLAAAAAIALWWGVSSRAPASAPVAAARGVSGGEASEEGATRSARATVDPMPLDFLLETAPASRSTFLSRTPNPIRGW